MKEPKIYIGPMSKNVVDVVIEANKDFPVALIPSRRQVEWNGGYVNNWDTLNFRNYVKGSNPNVILCRDHAGPGQGKTDDDGYESLKTDCLTMDIIHIDPWKVSSTIYEAAKKTCLMIASCYKNNPQMLYEIGTEEAIVKYEPEDLGNFISLVKQGTTPEEFVQIKYAVVQSGTGLDLPNGKNTGTFNGERLKRFINVVRKWELLSKEHNGDFLVPNNGIKTRVELGLDAINIAPEFGQIETETYLYYINKYQMMDVLEKFYTLCFESGKWKKWTGNRKLSKIQLIMTSGHYVLSHPNFQEIKKHFPDIDIEIRKRIKKRLYDIRQQTENNSI